jgi:hypothetical protein
MNGVIVGEEYEDRVRQSIEAKQLAKQMNEENRKERIIDSEDEFSDDRFAFITGYTSGSAAYGINHEEMRDYQEEKDEIDFNEIFKD